MTLITVSNYTTNLKESANPAGSSPDGNVYFDTAADQIQLIGADELAQVNFGAGLVTNPLNNLDGVTLGAIYAFETARRRLNETLRKFRKGSDGIFKYAGAFAFRNGVTLRSNDRRKIRGSGWSEFNASGGLARVYFGQKSLNPIFSGSQPYYLIPATTSDADRQAAAPANFLRPGPVDEAVQVFGDASNGNFDYRTRPIISDVRTFGETYGETSTAAAGITELAGFSAGVGLGESVNSANDYALADVFGGAAIAPWSTMTYTHYASAQSRSGFVGGSFNYSDIIANPAGGSLQQVRAYLDALMLQDTDQDAGAGSFIPKRAAPLYSLDASGRVVTRRGLHIDNLPEADKQLIVQTDDGGTGRTYPFNVDVRVSVSTAWRNDTNGWYHCYFKDGSGAADFDATGAVTVQDAAAADVKGTRGDARVVDAGGGNWEIRFSFAYDTNTQAGLAAGIDKTLVIEVEGDGGAVAASADIPVTPTAIVRATAAPAAETNI